MNAFVHTRFARPTLLTLALAGVAAAASEPDGPAAAPPGFSLTRTGEIHDFDFLRGAWTTQQRRLKQRGSGSNLWEDAPKNQHCATTALGGLALIEESRSPEGKPAGLFLYTFNAQKHQWSIFWVNPKTGRPDPGTVGGFSGSKGEFYGDDEDNGHAVKVRVTWTATDQNHARWEQAFSFDNQTWETNWVTDFTRADPGLCDKP
jgi:hypothetical protein